MRREESFEEFWLRYLRLHARPETRAWHAVATLSCISLVLVGVVAREPLLILLAPVVDFAIAQASHRIFERNKTRPWQAPLRHARAELRLLRLTLGLRRPRS